MKNTASVTLERTGVEVLDKSGNKMERPTHDKADRPESRASNPQPTYVGVYMLTAHPLSLIASIYSTQDRYSFDKGIRAWTSRPQRELLTE